MSGPEIADEIEQAAKLRHEQLLADPPTDGKAQPPRTPGKIGWSWEVLLNNRPVDIWMHEQDIRRAVRRPGGMDTLAAEHTTAVFVRGFPYVVGKRVAPPAGTTVVLDVTGLRPVHLPVEVEPSGRAVPLSSDPGDATVSLRMDLEGFMVLSGGRRPVEAVDVTMTGDESLGRQVLAAMAVTP